MAISDARTWWGAAAVAALFAIAPSPQARAQAMDMKGRSEMIVKAAQQAAQTDPAKWDWPAGVSAEARQSIIDAGYTPEERRNVFTVLVMETGTRWPNSNAPAPMMAPNPNDSRPFGSAGTTAQFADNPLYAKDVKFGGRGFRGLEELYGSNGYLMNSFSDRKNTVTYIIAKKDRVYFVFQFEAKHTGALFGFPGSGKMLDIRETATMRFRDGQVVETDFIGDDLSLYLQAGGKLSFPTATQPPAGRSGPEQPAAGGR